MMIMLNKRPCIMYVMYVYAYDDVILIPDNGGDDAVDGNFEAEFEAIGGRGRSESLEVVV